MEKILRVSEDRYISEQAGQLRPEIVDPIKEELLEDLVYDLVSIAETSELIEWEVDMETRRVTGILSLRIPDLGNGEL